MMDAVISLARDVAIGVFACYIFDRFFHRNSK